MEESGGLGLWSVQVGGRRRRFSNLFQARVLLKISACINSEFKVNDVVGFVAKSVLLQSFCIYKPGAVFQAWCARNRLVHYPHRKEFEMAGSKYWSGQECPKTSIYGQYNDKTNSYAGVSKDRHVKKGERFPPSENNHHFKEK